ncbi:hypothetical protein Fmac_011323 [Flemingia macrophylla]|uniref:Glycoside hydrolase family 13 N-terminal domain-containing protein n=1 Tax=Flemingia macrophylla TaxID=520843 RepID=A0ABD1MM53_9FABA
MPWRRPTQSPFVLSSGHGCMLHYALLHLAGFDNIKSVALIGDFNNWNPNADVMAKNEFGVWEIFLPNNVDGSPPIPHGSRVKNCTVKEDIISCMYNEDCSLFYHKQQALSRTDGDNSEDSMPSSCTDELIFSKPSPGPMVTTLRIICRRAVPMS